MKIKYDLISRVYTMCAWPGYDNHRLRRLWIISSPLKVMEFILHYSVAHCNVSLVKSVVCSVYRSMYGNYRQKEERRGVGCVCWSHWNNVLQCLTTVLTAVGWVITEIVHLRLYHTTHQYGFCGGFYRIHSCLWRYSLCYLFLHPRHTIHDASCPI